MAEKFWYEQATKGGSGSPLPGSPRSPTAFVPQATAGPYVRSEARSVASMVTSAAPTGFTTKTTYLKHKMDKLEAELAAERESRKRVEEDLVLLKSSLHIRS